MKSTRIATAFATLLLTPGVAIATPPTPEGSHSMYPVGEVSHGAHILIEGNRFDDYELTTAGGEQIDFELQDQSVNSGSSTTSLVVPVAPLESGTYTLRVLDYDPNTYDYYDPMVESVTFTITDDPMPPSPDPPTIEWRTAQYEGPEYLGIFPPDDPYGPDSPTSIVQQHRVVVGKDASVASFVSVTFEGLPYQPFETPHTMSSTMDFEHYETKPTPFIACVSATVKDIYGRTSEPTRICEPTHCAVRGANASRDTDWENIPEGCQDWSPGYAERNPASGSGCSTTPNPTVPGALAITLALIALMTGRGHRREEELERYTAHYQDPHAE